MERASYHHSDHRSAPTPFATVSAALKERCVKEAVRSKTNELGGFEIGGSCHRAKALDYRPPELLKLLDLRGRDVTMDALHTQRDSAKLRHKAGAHYVMALKGNQPTLLDEVRTFLGDPFVSVLEHEDTDAEHGWVETRVARVSTDIDWLAAHQWLGLAAIGRVDRTRICKRTGATTTESQLYLLGHADILNHMPVA